MSYYAGVKRAPAGIIAQAFKESVGNPGYAQPLPHFLRATGEWSTTQEEALRTLMEDVDHEIELVMGRIKRQQEKIQRETILLNHLLEFKINHDVKEVE